MVPYKKDESTAMKVARIADVLLLYKRGFLVVANHSPFTPKEVKETFSAAEQAFDVLLEQIQKADK